MADPAAAPVVRRNGLLALLVAGGCSALAGVADSERQREFERVADAWVEEGKPEAK